MERLGFLFVIALLLSMAILFYFWTRVHKFSFFQKMAKEKRLMSWILALLPIVILLMIGYNYAISMVVVILHLLVIWPLADLIGWLIKKKTGKIWTIYWQGIAAILFTILYLSAGWYIAHHVSETTYTVSEENGKTKEPLRVVQIADSHLGTTFDGEGFAQYLERIQKTDPDVFVLTGDFVDDDTKKEDMIRACEALGKLKTTYGAYFVFGNHDKGYFDYRDFTGAELTAELEKNHVSVLEDEVVKIREDVCLIGRQDKSEQNRASIEQLMQEAETNCYTIVLDHQPGDYEAEMRAEADLVLSGHTHGGWLFPMGIINRYIGPDDKIYGKEKRENTTFVVTSGISDWALPFKTGTISEYVVIDITGSP